MPDFDGRIKMQSAIRLLATAGLMCSLLAALASGCGTTPASPERTGDLVAGLITKTDTNPFFVTIKEGALRRAEQLDIELRTFAGEYDGDSQTQIQAVESLVAAGAKGILITPSDPVALGEAVRKARDAGVLVIALDTPFPSADSADATFATDNFRAGELIGRWARAKMDASAKDARIATLDGAARQITVEVSRNQGFLKGFGIDIKNPKEMYDEDDPRIVGSGATMGTESGGRKAMENLIQKYPEINLVYAINEPAAAGAYSALRALGLEEDVLIVSIDGSCSGVRSVARGEIGATSMQYPLKMASLGVEAVAEYSKTGRKPENTPGLDFHDTGVSLVTKEPVPGVPSLDIDQGLAECWE